MISKLLCGKMIVKEKGKKGTSICSTAVDNPNRLTLRIGASSRTTPRQYPTIKKANYLPQMSSTRVAPTWINKIMEVSIP